MTFDLHAMEAIKQLKYRYIRALDSADVETLGNCFIETASIKFEGGIYTAAVTGRGNIREAMANSFHSKAASSHLLHHPVIDVLDDANAEGSWTVRDTFYDLHHSAIISGVAEYRDEYVKEADGMWRMKYSSYKRLYETAQPLPSDLNFTARKLAETGKDLGLDVS